MPNLPYKTAGWDTHSEVKLHEIEYPLFDFGETAHYTVLRTYEGPLSTYSAQAINTADATFTSAYLVRQGPLIDIGGGCVRYERLYSTVPGSWSDLESYAYTFPGYEAGAVSAGVAVTAIVQSGANTVFTISSSASASAGDVISINVIYTRNFTVQSAMFSAVAVATTNTSQITVAKILPGSGSFSSVSGTAAKRLTGVPEPRALVVGSRIINDYALTSEANIDADLPLAPLFAPVTSAGIGADYLVSTSIPTAATYRTMVFSNTEIVAESIRRRYMGNIFVRQTRMIPAR
jgi:hypothetical protein